MLLSLTTAVAAVKVVPFLHYCLRLLVLAGMHPLYLVRSLLDSSARQQSCACQKQSIGCSSDWNPIHDSPPHAHLFVSGLLTLAPEEQGRAPGGESTAVLLPLLLTEQEGRRGRTAATREEQLRLGSLVLLPEQEWQMLWPRAVAQPGIDLMAFIGGAATKPCCCCCCCCCS